MKQAIIIAVLALILLSCGTKKTKPTDLKQPNIVLLFVDDLGWADLGFRNASFQTPNIDQLKDEGMNFERAYIATPTCSPSRTSILTGKEPVRIQMVRHITHEDEVTGRNESKFNLWEKDPVQMPSINWLPLEEITYAERLKEFGYYNMFIGKWHTGHEEYHPIHQGFDAQYGTGNHGHPKSYYAPFFKHGNPLPEFSKTDYLTDVLTAKSEEFIANYDKDQPFMLSLWYYNVHGPHIGRKDWVEKYKALGMDDRYAEYHGMVSAMDESVGRVRKALEEKDISDNTIILFTSDQGGFFTNAPLSGGKIGNTLGEGGARVPLIMHYPGVTKAGSSNSTPVQTLDLFPTLVEIASGKPCSDTQINGKSLMPLVNGKSMEARNLYFFRSYEDQYAAVIKGDWKLVKYHSGKFELFNVKDDISEQNNLIDVKHDIADKLKKEISEWEQEVVPEATRTNQNY